MRKVIFQNLISLDGFYEGPQKEIDWHNVDAEYNNYAIALLRRVDGLLFGRRTYELMAGYWPTSAAGEDDPAVAGLMNRLPKIVFSRTLERADWQNTRVARNEPGEETSRLKAEPGRDLVVLGSGELGAVLLRAGLIDEIQLIVNPIVLGGGKPLFSGIGGRQRFSLRKTRVFQSGNVLLVYEPVARAVRPKK